MYGEPAGGDFYPSETRLYVKLNPPEGSGILLLRRVRRGGRSAFSGGVLAAALARALRRE
jgi:hypothetical protein